MQDKNCGNIPFTISGGGDFIHMQPTFVTGVSVESVD
jgi:hypothetical protein